ncbi:5410_t:CDS:2, partial [Gigaspora rosea]
MISTYTLKKVNNQYQKAYRNTSEEPLPPCTRSFLSTMGLSCAHIFLFNVLKIQEHMPMLQIEESEDGLEPLLQNLQNKYQIWPEHQQAAARESISNIINAPLVNLQNPQWFELEDVLLVLLIADKTIQPEETLLDLNQ